MEIDFARAIEWGGIGVDDEDREEWNGVVERMKMEWNEERG